mmetsp:Transcript_75683/g.204633  ORF Transcript_75683/g.204633 Transcript_75683/m.204633 type:complete len:580 (-) Transcript_75683:128-1867(-)
MTATALACCLLATVAVAPAAALSLFRPGTAKANSENPAQSATDAMHQADRSEGMRNTINEIEKRADGTSGVTLLRAVDEIATRTDATKQALVDAAVEIASQPMHVLQLGVPVIAQKAKIATDTFSKAMSESIQMLGEGDVAGALKVASTAIAKYQKTNDDLDESTSAAAWRAVGILAVFLLIGLAWTAELFLARGGQQDPEQKDDEELVVRGRTCLAALGFTRYIFCWLAVANNFHNPGRQNYSVAGAFTILARWGGLAWPWFFVVSGFSNSLSKILGPDPNRQEDWLAATCKRVSTWYPFYAMALTVCAARAWTVNAEDWCHYLGNMVLINGLIWSEPSFPYALVGQWLSFLTVYLMGWSQMHQVINSESYVVWTLLSIACLIAIPSAVMEWYFFADTPLWVLIQYWPSFCFGQALATWFSQNCMRQRTPNESRRAWAMRPEHEIPLPVRFGPTISFLALGVSAFCFSPHDRLPLIRKPLAPLLLKGGLLPLMGIMVAGLACQKDPIAKLFARAPFRWTEKVCLMTFVLQAPVHYGVQHWTRRSGLTWTFATSLLVASILGHAFLEQPWRTFLGVRAK